METRKEKIMKKQLERRDKYILNLQNKISKLLDLIDVEETLSLELSQHIIEKSKHAYRDKFMYVQTLTLTHQNYLS